MLEAFFRDLRYSARMLRKSPGFTAVALLVLALGIGSNLAVFSLIDALLLRPIPVARPAELVRVSGREGVGVLQALPSTLLDALRNERVFQGVCGFETPLQTAEIAGRVAPIGTHAWTADCFDTLGVRTQLGRPFTNAQEQQGAENVVLLSGSEWRGTFGARRDVLGKKIVVDGALFTILGVVEDRFTGLLLGFPPGLIMPLRQQPLYYEDTAKRQTFYWVYIFARRAPGVSETQVQARLRVLEKTLLPATVPPTYNPAQREAYLAQTLMATPAGTGVDWMLRNRFEKPLTAILFLCAAILCIACVNLANLLLARGLHRRKEVAVRLALGASRTSVARLFSLETSILVLSGCALGLLFARWTGALLSAQASSVFSGLRLDPSFDVRTIAFVAVLVLAVALALSLASAWQVTGFSSETGLKDAGRGVVGSGARGRKFLLGLQIAFTLALVAGSGLLASSWTKLSDMDVGLRMDGVSEAMLMPRPGGYRNFAPGPYYHELLLRVEALPDAASAGFSDMSPLWNKLYPEPVSVVENPAGRPGLKAAAIAVTGGAFETLGIPIVTGDGFNDRPGEPSAIVSRSLANRLGGTAIIGRHLRIGERAAYRSLRVTGIARDAQWSLENPGDRGPFTVYVDFWRYPQYARYPALLVRSKSGAPIPAAVLASAIVAQGREYLERYRSLDRQKDEALIEERLLAWLSGAFGLLALALAATGLFGLLSYHVASRTGEIGLRMALGAQSRQIEALVVRQIAPVVACGILGGLVLALLTGKLIAGLVFGVQVRDARLLGASVLVLLLTAVAAAWIPARRAASIGPLAALRQE